MTYDLLIEGATVLPSAFAAAIDDAAIGIAGGRFAFVGRRGALPADMQAKQRLRLEGHVVIPGLVNVHTHTILTMVRGTAEDMGFAPAYTKGVPQAQMLTPDETVALARLGALEALLGGCTMINDVYVHARHTMPAIADLGLRVWGCNRLHDVDFDAVLDGRWEHSQAIGAAMIEEAEEMIARFHGKPRMGIQLAPHAPDTCSTPYLEQLRDLAARHDLRLQTHLCQSPAELRRVAEREGCTPVELLARLGMLHDRLVAAHCIHVTEADIAALGAAGVHVAHIPKNNAASGRYAPTRALAEAGAKITLATDNRHGDMVEAMRWGLCMGRIQTGRVEDSWQPEHMLHAATEAGAAAMGLGAELGRVAPGMLADLTIINLARPHLVPHNDPLGTRGHTGRGRDVSHVVVEGEVVVAEGRPTRCDPDQVIRDGAAAAAALWERARAEA